MDIAHVAIWTADPERFADFYCGFFGAQSGAPLEDAAAGPGAPTR